MSKNKTTESIVTTLLYETLKRKKMPQFDSEDIDQLKDILEEKGILFTEEVISAEKLKPLQKDYSSDKVEKMKDKIKNDDVDQLMVSEDYFILDGHHRWKAGCELEENVSVFRIHLPKHKALVMLDDSVRRIKNDNEKMDIVAVYPGRFQPFHRGHWNTFKILRDHFGKNHCYISMSDKVEGKRSPFNFEEKKKIITNLYNIPRRFVVENKNPYRPVNILKNYDENNTALVIGINSKEGERIERLTGKYFKEYSPNDIKPFKEQGYLFTVKKDENFQLKDEPISGSNLREMFRSDIKEKYKKKLFEYVYKTFDEKIYNLIMSKLNDDHDGLEENRFFKKEELDLLSDSVDFKKVLNEAARTAAAVPSDDGPASWYADRAGYKDSEKNLAQKMGYEVIDHLFDEKHFEGDPSDFKQDALKFVSFFPTGVFDEHVSNPLKIYHSFSDAVAETAGYKVMKHIGIDDPVEKDSITDEGGSSQETEKMKDTGGIAALDESLEKRLNETKDNNSASHLRHPYENLTLSFDELDELIYKIFRGDLENPREKTDGQNLKVTWKNGKLKAARNKGGLKNRGSGSMLEKDIADKFEGRGDIKDAFVLAFQDLKKCFDVIPVEILNKVFRNGKRFLSLEIIYSPTQNVIPYEENMLIFQEVNTYARNGELLDRNSNLSELLINSVENFHGNETNTFKIKKQPVVDLESCQGEKKKILSKVLSVLKREKDRYGLKGSDPILKNQVFKWKNFINKKALELDYSISNDIRKGLIHRWCFDEKSGENGYSLRSVKSDIEHQDFLSFVLDFDKNKLRKKRKNFRRPFEFVFLRVGAEILKDLDFPLIEDEQKNIIKIKNNIKETVQKIKNLEEKEAVFKLNEEIKRINMSGGLKKLAPSEGIVFYYHGELYKLTGLFAPVNQILGLIKYRRY